MLSQICPRGEFRIGGKAIVQLKAAADQNMRLHMLPLRRGRRQKPARCSRGAELSVLTLSLTQYSPS